MTTLARLASHLSYDDPARAEVALLRGAIAGALASMLLVGLSVLFSRATPTPGPLVLGVSAALLFVLLPRQSTGLLMLLAAATGVVALLSPTPARLMPFFFTGGLGLLLSLERETWLQRGVALVGPSLGALWGLQVLSWLSARYLGAFNVLGTVTLAFLGVFIAAGAAAAGLEWSADTLEPRLRGDPKVQGTWARLRRALARLPEGSDRRLLQSLAVAAIERWLAARAEAQGVSASLDEELELRAKDALLQLDVRLETTTDTGVADSLRHLARVHRDTLEQFDGLRRRKERLDATAATEAAWLETAAFTVELAPRAESARHDMATRLEALRAAR